MFDAEIVKFNFAFKKNYGGEGLIGLRKFSTPIVL